MFRGIKVFGRIVKKEVEVYRSVMIDARTPWLARLLLCLAIGYLLLPFDLIPDFIPFIGHVDDLILVTALIILAVRMIPPEVMEDCRARVGKHDIAS